MTLDLGFPRGLCHLQLKSCAFACDNRYFSAVLVLPSDGPTWHSKWTPFSLAEAGSIGTAFSGYYSGSASGGPSRVLQAWFRSCLHPLEHSRVSVFSVLRRTWSPGVSRKAQGIRGGCRAQPGSSRGEAGSGFRGLPRPLSPDPPGLWAACRVRNWVRTERPSAPHNLRAQLPLIRVSGAGVQDRRELRQPCRLPVGGPLWSLQPLSVQTPQEETGGQRVLSALGLR